MLAGNSPSCTVMGKKSLDPEVRGRVAAWLRYFRDVKYAHEYKTNDDFARRGLGLSPPTVANIINGKRTAGLDVVLQIHRRFHVSADTLLDTNPPKNQTLRLIAP